MNIRFVAVLMIVLITAAIAISGMAGENDSTQLAIEEGDSLKMLDNLDWLVGRWVGEAFGGVCEEVWNPATGGSMAGTFKLVTEGKVAFYEFCTITVGPAGPVLRLKHFNADLTGWEEKDDVIEFGFKNQVENEINFDGLTYRLKAADELYIAVVLKNKDGQVEKVEINCTRAK